VDFAEGDEWLGSTSDEYVSPTKYLFEPRTSETVCLVAWLESAHPHLDAQPPAEPTPFSALDSRHASRDVRGFEDGTTSAPKAHARLFPPRTI